MASTDLDLFEYAANQRPWRNTDPETSVEAGSAARKFIGEHHFAILGALRQSGRPMAAEEIADALGWESHIPANRRLSELVDCGQIAPTDERHKNRSGRSAVRYHLTPKGIDP